MSPFKSLCPSRTYTQTSVADFFTPWKWTWGKKLEAKEKHEKNWIQNTKQYDKNKRMRTEITKKNTKKVWETGNSFQMIWFRDDGQARHLSQATWSKRKNKTKNIFAAHSGKGLWMKHGAVEVMVVIRRGRVQDWGLTQYTGSRPPREPASPTVMYDFICSGKNNTSVLTKNASGRG